MAWREISIDELLEVSASNEQKAYNDGYQDGWRAAMCYIEKLKAGVIEYDKDSASVKL